jgi:hypothetical protein
MAVSGKPIWFHGKSSFFTTKRTSVHPEMVDFGSGQGRSEFVTNGKAVLRRRRCSAPLRIAKE